MVYIINSLVFLNFKNFIHTKYQKLLQYILKKPCTMKNKNKLVIRMILSFCKYIILYKEIFLEFLSNIK